MGKKILIIDDNISLLGVMETVLNYEGFEVLTSPVANNYQNMISRNEVDLVIIDYLLQGTNGGEICYQIKQCPESRHLPVIILSAYDIDSQLPAEYGCDVFIPKPFNLEDIVAQVSKLLH